MNRLVVQLPIDGDTDFDSLLHVEETLSRAFNILIHGPDSSDLALVRITQLLEGLGVLSASVVASFRPATQSYEVLYPAGYVGKFVL